MTALKYSMIPLVFASFVVSCSSPREAGPVVQLGPDLALMRAQKDTATAAEIKERERQAEAQRKIEEKLLENKKKADQLKKEIEAHKTRPNIPKRPPLEKPTKKRPKYPVAKRVPGRPGFIFNPYTYEAVDVRGIPGGSLVLDPNDPNKRRHKFRVP